MLWNARVCYHSLPCSQPDPGGHNPEPDEFNIRFFKHTEYIASIYLHNFLRISATCKHIYALPSTLHGEDTQNGKCSRTMGRITSGDIAAVVKHQE
jgi:hypothetical protein